MKNLHLGVFAMVSITVLGGCGGGSSGTIDAGADGGPPRSDAGRDAFRDDAGSREDAQPARDAGSDAGRTDAGERDSGVDAGFDAGVLRDDTSCDDVHAGAFFCDGFEHGLVRWTSGAGGGPGSFETVSSPVFRGRFAAQARSLAATTTSYAYVGGLGGRTTGDLYVRLWMLIPAASPVMRLDFLGAQQIPSPRAGFSVGMVSAHSVTAQLSTASHAFDGSDAAFVRDRWQCVEAHVHLDSTAGSLDVSVDGTSVLTAAPWNTVPATGYDDVYIGITGVEAGHPATELYFDEVVIDDAPIGCTD